AGTISPLVAEGGGVFRATYVAPEGAPAEAPTVRVVDKASAFEQSVEVPLRDDPRRLLVGVRAGVAYSLGDQLAAPVGADVLVPVRAGAQLFFAGATASYA